MVGGSRLVGLLIVAGVVVLGLGALGWLVAAWSEGTLGGPGAVLGVLLVLLIAVPGAAAGAYLFALGRAEATAHDEAQATRRLLNMVNTRGKVRLSEAAAELGLPPSAVREVVRDAVGHGLFSGYYNANEGVLYAREAAEGVQPCPNCGGTIEIAGRGVFQCPYCGTELFHSHGAAGRHEIRGVAPPSVQQSEADASEGAGLGRTADDTDVADSAG
jgi:hypothetical protein